LVPGITVYLLWIIGDWGYVLSILPGLYVLCAALLSRALSRPNRSAVFVVRVALLAVVAGTALSFVLADARWSAGLLAAHDASVSGRVAYISANFAPATTVLLAREDYQLARYYLGAYRTWLYDPAPATTDDPPKSTDATVIVFTPDLILRQRIGMSSVGVGRGWRLSYVPAPAAGILLFGVDPIAREP
jgi:hypothetical protein